MEGSGDIFATPKPIGLLQRVVTLAAPGNAVVLDSFAGSGTTAHAVLAANAKDNGSRKFILVECEDYADDLTAERVRRVVNGYLFSGKQKEELLREKITYTKFKQADRVFQQIAEIEEAQGDLFDEITKKIDDGELIVTGERRIEEHMPGLGGSFTFCTLGPALDLDALLTGEILPAYESLAAVLFHMATNLAFEPANMDVDVLGFDGLGYLGASGSSHIWLLYKPDLDFLKSAEAALTLSKAQAIAAHKPDERHVVYAPSRFVSQKMLRDAGLPVEFAPLPYALYRIQGG